MTAGAARAERTGIDARLAWTALAIFAVEIAVRIVAAAFVPFPVPEDTAYYVDAAQSLVAGHGLTTNALWSYGTQPLVLPRPAFEVWLPLPSLIAAVPIALLGGILGVFGAAQIVSVTAGGVVAVLAWRLAADLAEELALPPARARMLAIGSGISASLYGPLVLHSTLPDSTMLFTALAVAACLVMTRIARNPEGARATDRRLLGLGVLLGLAALTRNEVLWLGIAWVGIAWLGSSLSGQPGTRAARARLIVVPALIAAAFLAPWLVRNMAAFGTPMPGQTIANALSTTGFDIFAWSDPPTVSRYLSRGIGALVADRVDGFLHNTFNVLVIPGMPVAPIGILALVRFGNRRTIRPLVIAGGITFAVTTLVFPVSTTWGTFLHAAGLIQVLLVVAALAGLDALIARVARARAWTKPVAWLGPMLTVVGALPILAITVGGIGSLAAETRDRYDALEAAVNRGLAVRSSLPAPLTLRTSGPIISDHPIWIAHVYGTPALALPDESVESVRSLAARFHAGLLLLTSTHGSWPATLALAIERGDPAAACFQPIDLTNLAAATESSLPAETRAYRVSCE